jgi:hypothetical protein
MNNCCNDCPHQKVDTQLKKLYNIYARPTFNVSDCPFEDDDDKLGCMAKMVHVEWDDFKKFLADNGMPFDE